MKKIKFEVPEFKQIEINGHIFDIQKADTDIMEKASELRNKYSKLSANAGEVDFDEIVGAVKTIISYIDEVLGEGATKTITNGRPIGIVAAVQLMTDICTAVVEEYNQSVNEKYE